MKFGSAGAVRCGTVRTSVVAVLRADAALRCLRRAWVNPPLTHALAETAPRWAEAIAPAAEVVAGQLARSERSRLKQLSTPRTGSDRSARYERTQRLVAAPATRPARPLADGQEGPRDLTEAQARHTAETRRQSQPRGQQGRTRLGHRDCQCQRKAPCARAVRGARCRWLQGCQRLVRRGR
jgi:hypothetical protein